MEGFLPAPPTNARPISIKIRITSGCFHREHSKEAYTIIDDYVRHADLSDVQYEIVEHESGPEILVYLAVVAAGLGAVKSGLDVVKSVIELVTAIVKARSEGIKRGDHPRHPLELIVRGYDDDGKYFEEKVLQIEPQNRVTPKQIETALKKGIAAKKPKTKSSRTR
jgi:hypothetical protein